MRSLTCYLGLLAASALASPLLNQRDLAEGVATSQHSHLEYHLVKARQKVAARALAAGDSSGETPAENVLDELDELFGESQGEGPSDGWHIDESQSQPQAQALDSPLVIITEYLTTCISTSSASPATTSGAQASTTTQAQTEDKSTEESAEQQAAAKKAAEAKAAAQKAAEQKVAAEKAAAEKAAADKAAQQQQQAASKTQSTPQPQPPQTPPQTQAKPQPTQHQPAAGPPSGSGVSTDNLPTEFVPNLDTESAIYQGLSKQHHDIHRKNHSMDPLAWNDTLFEYAKETAKSCIYGHSLAPGGGGYGQNIAAGNAPGNISAVLTNGYYNGELELFLAAIGHWGNNSPDMSNFEEWGHVTQMLWKDTTSFACYTATCSPPGADPLNCDGNGQSYLKNVGCGNGGTEAYNTVCNYYPPGNYANEYSAVPPPAAIMGFVEMTLEGIVGLH